MKKRENELETVLKIECIFQTQKVMKSDVPGTKSPILADVVRASRIVATSGNAHSKTFVILPKVLTLDLGKLRQPTLQVPIGKGQAMENQKQIMDKSRNSKKSTLFDRMQHESTLIGITIFFTSLTGDGTATFRGHRNHAKNQPFSGNRTRDSCSSVQRSTDLANLAAVFLKAGKTHGL